MLRHFPRPKVIFLTAIKCTRWFSLNTSWHHFKKVLPVLGYKQAASSSGGYLYFVHPVMNKIITEKKNKFHQEQILKYLGIMKLPLVYFEHIYKRCEER